MEGTVKHQSNVQSTTSLLCGESERYSFAKGTASGRSHLSVLRERIPSSTRFETCSNSISLGIESSQRRTCRSSCSTWQEQSNIFAHHTSQWKTWRNKSWSSFASNTLQCHQSRKACCVDRDIKNGIGWIHERQWRVRTS